ncbi:phospholipase effector Tle1 domain-containing protein [Bradyrhizobium sp. CCBAU 51753]|uniref:phospholipase effector Tle1 domain-containing protein n=1 Tax=Bradyrhizobium sp. CCBAU 51753 TaxID=1325100 RepID=UPI00353054B2
MLARNAPRRGRGAQASGAIQIHLQIGSRTPCRCFRLFIAIWDAVAAIGWQRFFPDWAYDRHFTTDVQYARHLQSIDEGRKDFKRVPWGASGTVKWLDRQGEPEQFDQIWFAGNHADMAGAILRTSLGCLTSHSTGWWNSSPRRFPKQVA